MAVCSLATARVKRSILDIFFGQISIKKATFYKGTFLPVITSDRLGGAESFRELLGQTKVMQIHQGAITHEVCCLVAQQHSTN